MPGDNQIDISLSLLGQQSGAAFDNFVKSVASIESSMQAMLATSQQVLTEANLATAQNFGGGGNGSRSTQSGGGSGQQQRSGEASAKASTGARKSPIDGLPLPKKVREALRGDLALGEEAQGLHSGGFENVRPLRVFTDTAIPMRDRIKLSAGHLGGRLEGRLASASHRGGMVGWAVDHPIEAYYGAQQVKHQAQAVAGWVGAHNPANTGAALGYASDSGGPLAGNWGPMRSPLSMIPGLGSEAATHGFTEMAQRRWKGAITPGISGGDVGEIQNVLYGLGWQEGDGRDRMEDGMIALKQRYKGMDMEKAGQMVDQGVRYGSGDVTDMVDMLKQVPKVARNARMGMNEFLASMDEVANAAQSQGASYQQGALWAQESSRVTGWDPRVSQKLAETPWVQTRVMAQTGLMPQEQGLLDPNARAAMTSSSIQEMLHMYSGFGDSQTKDKWGGTTTVNGNDRAIAFTADQLGVDPDVVRAAMKDAPRQQGMDDLGRMTRGSKHNVDLLIKRGDYAQAEKLVRDPNYVNKDDKYTSWGETLRMMQDGKAKGVFKQTDIDAVRNTAKDKLDEAKKEKDPAKRAKLVSDAMGERQQKAKEIIDKSTEAHRKDQESGGKDDRVKVDISLKGDAAKLFEAKTFDPLSLVRGKAKAGSNTFLNPDTLAVPRLAENEATRKGLHGMGSG